MPKLYDVIQTINALLTVVLNSYPSEKKAQTIVITKKNVLKKVQKLKKFGLG